ncbi:MAG: hypothetical protein Phyf2KO_08310 [Phycisphaerales bacterium]
MIELGCQVPQILFVVGTEALDPPKPIVIRWCGRIPRVRAASPDRIAHTKGHPGESGLESLPLQDRRRRRVDAAENVVHEGMCAAQP